MTLLTVIVLVVQVLSVAILVLMTFEFLRLHGKRVVLLSAIGSARVRGEVTERNILVAIYVLSTAVILVVTTLLYV